MKRLFTVFSLLLLPLGALALPDAFDVSLSAPNRVSVRDARIVNAVYDQSRLEVQTDETTGEIFVIPKNDEETVLYLTTDAGESLTLTLVPRKIASQDIVLNAKKRKSAVSQNPPAPDPAPEFDARIKKLIRAAALNEAPPGFDSLELPRKTPQKGKAVLLRVMKGAGLEARVLLTQGARPLERGFIRKGALGAAVEEISPGTFAVYAVFPERSKP